MGFSPENSRTTINCTFLFCFLFFSISYLHDTLSQTTGNDNEVRQRTSKNIFSIPWLSILTFLIFLSNLVAFVAKDIDTHERIPYLQDFSASRPENPRQQSRQPTDNEPCNQRHKSGNPLLWKFQLAAFFLTQFYKSAFVAGQFVAGRFTLPAPLPTITGKHPRVGKWLPA